MWNQQEELYSWSGELQSCISSPGSSLLISRGVPPGGYLYPFHIVPAMKSIHKTTIIAGFLLSWWCVQGENGVSQRCVLVPGSWVLGCFIQDQVVKGPAWQLLAEELCRLVWTEMACHGHFGGQSSDTSCDISSCVFGDQSEWVAMGWLARIPGVLGLKSP